MPNEHLTPLPVFEDFERLVLQANTGDPTALDQLKRMLDEHPQIWHAVGDLGRHAQLAMIRGISGGDQLVLESIKRQLQQLEEDLTGDSCSPLERLAVQRVVTAWLEVQHATLQAPGQTASAEKARARAQQAAQRRFDAAMKSILVIRKALATKPKADKPPAAPKRTRSTPKPETADNAAFVPGNRISVFMPDFASVVSESMATRWN